VRFCGRGAWGVGIFADRADWQVVQGWENPDGIGSEMAKAFGMADAAPTRVSDPCA
jgi:hypothetical protein